MEHARHVFRVMFLLLVVVATLAIARTFAVPETYGLHGPYRHADVAEQMARPAVHGGVESCAPCHAKQAEARRAGAHKTVNCEVCHGPVGNHAAEGKRVAPMPIERSWQLCARCHRKIVGRPEKFPQQDLETHVPEKLEGSICIECHDPHSPQS